MSEDQIRTIYVSSVETNRNAFAEGEYEIAYRTLLVALECGQRLRDIGCLTEVERLAQRESRYIDDHRPEYSYSNKTAISRGGIGVFQMAARQATVMIKNIR